MLKVTGYVMRLAPLAIFAALAGDRRDERGWASCVTYAKFVGGFYLSLGVLCGRCCSRVGFAVVGRAIGALLSG